MAFGGFKGLRTAYDRTAYDKILRGKAFYIPKNTKYDGYQRGLASMIYSFFIKKLLVVLLCWHGQRR